MLTRFARNIQIFLMDNAELQRSCALIRHIKGLSLMTEDIRAMHKEQLVFSSATRTKYPPIIARDEFPMVTCSSEINENKKFSGTTVL